MSLQVRRTSGNDFTDEETEVVDMSVQKLLDNVHLLIDRDLDNFSSKSNI